MQYMYKLFRKLESDQFIEKYKARFNAETTIRFNLHIKPMKQPNVFELYYVPTNNMFMQMEVIYQISTQINTILNHLPPIAKEQYVRECLADELYNTNELEGVQSTRNEIVESIRELELKGKDNIRFQSMIQSYMKLLEHHRTLPTKSEDIRHIYDEITEGEIKKEDLPDGKLFRKDIVKVYKKSGSGKVIHRGIIPEENIVTELQNMLNMLNEMTEVPLLVRIAVGHYYFGYIHPFYDGNGRTSRYISSLYLAESLGEIPALVLSRGCNQYKTKYLEAFERSNSLMNRGEMNLFIDSFFHILLDMLLEMYGELKEKVELMNLAMEKLSQDPQLTNEKHEEFMFVLAQNNFFSNDPGLTVSELANILGLSETTVRKIAHELVERSLVQQRGNRPIFYYIDDAYFEK